MSSLTKLYQVSRVVSLHPILQIRKTEQQADILSWEGGTKLGVEARSSDTESSGGCLKVILLRRVSEYFILFLPFIQQIFKGLLHAQQYSGCLDYITEQKKLKQ